MKRRVLARFLAAVWVVAAVAAAGAGAATGSLPTRLAQALHLPFVNFAASGAVRCKSNHDSSPRTLPLTDVMPSARTCRAREARSADESVGSP